MPIPSPLRYCLLTLAAASASADACHPDTGERLQRAYFSWGADSLDSWTADGDDMSLTRLPTGQTLALRVAEPTNKTYREAFAGRQHNVELVVVEVFDASSKPYTLVYSSLGGANSSSGIPSARLPDEVLANLRINLSRPVCVSAESLAAAHPDDGG